MRPETDELNLISSIASTNIRRIAFTQLFSSKRQAALDNCNWTKLDEFLYRLVDRLEGGVQLEVEFRALNAQAWWTEELGFKKYLPRFCGKGGANGR